MAGAIVECPKCKCQLEVTVKFASGPKRPAIEPPKELPPLVAGYTILERLEQCEERRDLNAWEKEFVDSLRERYDEYGDRVKLSPKQREVLESIAEGKRR